MNAVFIKDNIAYCAGALGLSIFDVSNPRQPRIMSNVTLPSPAYGVYVSGSYAYVADDWAGLRIIDVSNPSSPVEISFYDTPGDANSVYVLGSYAYVADGEAGLRIIDVSNPSSPREVSFYDTPSAAEGVYVLGSYAYVADAYRGLRIIDVSNPSSPVEVGFYDTPGYAQSVYVLGSYAYVADVWAGLRIIDVSNPSSPREVSYYSTVWAVGAYVSGSYAYVADGKAGLRIIDVSNPSSPVEVSFYDTLGSAVGVYVSGQYAYVADGSAGLLIIDVSNPSSPVEIGFYDTPVQAFGVYVSGQYAYVAAEYEGLRVIDVSNPSSPVEVGFYDTPGSAYSVYVSGSYAYVADGGAGLRIIDVSNPSSPVEVSFYDTLGSAVGVYVSGQYAYVADGSAGLLIIDVSNPSSPVEIGFYDTPGKARSVYVSGQYAYVADEESGLWIIDVSNPFSPGGVGHYDTPGYAWSVYVQGQYAYVADWMAGLRIIDVSNPASPTEVGFFNTPEYAYAWGVYISGQYAYVAAGEAGLLILRFTGAVINQPPSVPVLISPSEGEIVSPTPTFRLRAEDPDGDQVRFEIQVVKGDETRTFTTGFVASGAEATFVVLSNQALSEGQWRWKAKAIDTSGAESGWSEERTFTVQAPPVTWTLLEPFGPVAQVPIFRFKAELNPPPTERLQYRVEISRDPQFSEQVIVFDQSVDPTGWSQSDYAPEEIAVFIAHYAFPLNAQLYWRARVKKVGEDAYSDPSPAQLFRVIRGFNITPPDRIRVGRIERIPITIYNPSPVPQEFIISHEVSTNDPNFGGRARLIDPRGTVLDEVTISPNEVALLQFITPPLEQGRHIFFVEVEVRENQRVENTTRALPVLGFVGSVVVGVAVSFVAEKLCEELAKAVLKRDYGFTDEEANTVMDVIKEAGEEATEKELGERAVSNMVKEELERRGKRELAGKLFRKVGTKGIPYVWVVFTLADCAEGLSKATKATKSPPAAPPIVRSWDPNMKVGILGREGFIQAEETLAYRILFENIPPPPPAIPAPAQEVIITDILDENIDLSTLTFTSVGFGNHTITFPDETRTISVDVDLGEVEGKRLVVQIRGQLDVNTRTLEVSFRGIDPETGQLHPVGFLPVNNNPPEGEGWVAFEVRLKEDVQSGTQIKNKASIKFDVNPPMETNEVVVTVDRIAPESRVTEITNGGISFEANDDVSGIDVVELWVSEERVNFRGTRQVIIGDRKYSLHSTLSGSATPKFSFRGKFGYNYRFYTVARDIAGNKEPEPDDSDARVTIGQPPTLPAGLHMVSVPVESEDADPKEVFLFEGNKWARWDPEARGGQGGYVFYDNDPTGFTRFSEPEKVPGRGYWVYIPQQTIVQVYGDLPDETKPFVIPLKRGWNQIGNPWLSDLVWDINEIKVQVGNETKPMKDARGIVELYAWRWDGSNYQLIFDQNILPNVDNRIPAWEGAWVYAWQDCNLIVPPPQGNRSRQGRMAREAPEGWFAKLVAQIGDGKGEGFFGILPKTRLQISQPPSPPERQGDRKVQVLFLDKGGNPSIADIKAGMGQRQEWDVVVGWETGQKTKGTGQVDEVAVTFDGIGYAPKGVSLWLVDTVTGQRIYMRTQSAYRFKPQEGETSRRFKIIAELGNERPLRIVGLKATPMRGQGVVVEFGLTKPAQVVAEVLTLTGRRAAVLEGQTTRSAGTHRLIWRGTNGNGVAVGTGVFLVRLIATDEEGRQVQAVTTVSLR